MRIEVGARLCLTVNSTFNELEERLEKGPQSSG